MLEPGFYWVRNRDDGTYFIAVLDGAYWFVAGSPYAIDIHPGEVVMACAPPLS